VAVWFLKKHYPLPITPALMYKKINTQQVLNQYFPPETFSTVEACFRDFRFDLRISKPRKNKLGSYRAGQKDSKPLITVNSDLGKYMFFLVFMHEIAHLKVHSQHGRAVLSHGKEWKATFSQMIIPMLDSGMLPAGLEKPLRKYLVNPAATFIRQTELMKVINQLDGKKPVDVLNDIPLQSVFALANGMRFVKLEKRRTRCRCLCLDNKRYYDVACNAQIFRVSDGH